MIEYTEGIYIQDLATVEGEIKLAESDLTRSEDRLDWARRMFDKGYVSMATKVSEELTFKKAQFALEQAQSKLKVLTQYTKEKTIKELEQRGRRRPTPTSWPSRRPGSWRGARKRSWRSRSPAARWSPRSTAWSSTPTTPAGASAAPSRRSRKARRSASGRRSSASPTSPRCRSTPRSTSRRSTRSRPR